MYTEIETLCTAQTSTIRQAMTLMDRSRLGIVLVVDGRRRLTGTITDGDIRRAMLDRIELDQPVATLLARKAKMPYVRPITARQTADRTEHLKLLQQHRISHLPILDVQERVIGLVTLDEFVTEQKPLEAVVMAGGQGQRLSPLTADLPKPMLPIGDRPIMEIILEQLRDAGVTQVTVTTHHKAEKITEYFGDGTDFGMRLSYVEEAQPLGTVGGLGLLGPLKETTLVINGDILTHVDFRAMTAFHREHQADLTVAVRHYEMKVPYGVVECNGPLVRGVSEKPVMGFFVNAGIYLLEPSVCAWIPRGCRFDMTDLIECLVKAQRTVVSFPIREYWLDIGQHSDYERAQEHAKQWKVAAQA